MKRNKKLICFLFAIIILVLGIHCVSNIAVFEIIKLPDTVYAEISDLEYVNRSNEFGKYIDISYENEIKSTPTREITAKIKLFNLITLKEFQVKIKEETVYVPGKAIGFSLESKGLIVLGNNLITTENGKESALENSLLKKGDIILKIEGETLNSIKDMNKIINKEENKGRELKVEAIRNNKIYDTIVTPKLEKSTGTYKLGIWVKDSTNGVGTLTYIKKDNLRFGALGHPITDSDTKNEFKIKSGEIYNCNVIGVTKGYKGNPGELKGLFFQGKDSQGIIDKNMEYGVYGQINDDSILKNSEELKVGGRFVARPGKAKIRACIDGTESKDYDVEIIKTNYQSASNDKSMVIKVTDKELLRKTGGIVQGMSGSPIIQNNKVIGAITHVFVNDPTKGFGIYLDWMLNE